MCVYVCFVHVTEALNDCCRDVTEEWISMCVTVSNPVVTEATAEHHCRYGAGE